MIVTRNTFCTPENIGNGSIDTDPVPCVLSGLTFFFSLL